MSFEPFLPALPREHPCYNIPLDFRIKTVNYSNDNEYRAVLETLCFNNIDNEQYMQYVFDYVWENTNHLPIFLDLYKSAAAGYLLSEDASLGLAILFSYDYLCDFYSLFRDYMANPEFDETAHPLQTKLKMILSIKSEKSDNKNI